MTEQMDGEALVIHCPIWKIDIRGNRHQEVM